MTASPRGIEIRPLRDTDASAAEALLRDELGGRQQVRLGELVDVLTHPAIGAFDGARLVGIATHEADGERVELSAVAVASTHRNRHIGTALVDAVANLASSSGATSVWLVTTNDNLDALRVYQRHGFRITDVRRGGVEDARVLKPQIPPTGRFGIPMHDELVLERTVTPD